MRNCSKSMAIFMAAVVVSAVSVSAAVADDYACHVIIAGDRSEIVLVAHPGDHATAERTAGRATVRDPSIRDQRTPVQSVVQCVRPPAERFRDPLVQRMLETKSL